MLIQFNYSNFKSFKDETTLDMTASSIKEHLDNIANQKENKYLKVTAIYGANSSGKSNVIEAFLYMKSFVKESFVLVNKWEEIPLKRFAFDENSKKKLSMFEVFFEYKGEIYQYGFELDSKEVKEEWLYKKDREYKSERYDMVFVREKENFELSEELKNYSEILKGISEKTLILSVLANLKIENIKNVFDWFEETTIINFGNPLIDTIKGSILPEELKKDNIDELTEFKNFLSDIDVGIKGIKLEEESSNNEKKRYKAFSVHFNNDTNQEEYISLKEESDGTLKMISMYSDLKRCLKKGSTLFVDELDAKLHPLLTKYIIQIFHNKKTNPNNAQLIYTTHDVINLTKEIFRRDEIWFVEKDKKNISHLYSLAEYKIDDKKVRNDASYNKDYLLGRYGALPILKEFEVGD